MGVGGAKSHGNCSVEVFSVIHGKCLVHPDKTKLRLSHSLVLGLIVLLY